jgi:hypothetical protein
LFLSSLLSLLLPLFLSLLLPRLLLVLFLHTVGQYETQNEQSESRCENFNLFNGKWGDGGGIEREREIEEGER